MDLTELQRELRILRQEINKLEVAVVRRELKSEEKRDTEYKVIDSLASQYPLTRKVLVQAEESTQHMYIRILGSLAISEAAHRAERLLYISKIAMGMGWQEKASERIVELGSKLDVDDLHNLFIDVEQAKESFLLDAFIVANICGKASEQMMVMLAALIQIFGCNKEDTAVIAAVAKGVLTDDFSGLDRIDKKFPDDVLEQWLSGLRVCCGQYCISTDLKQHDNKMIAVPRCQVKKIVEAGTAVKVGEELVSYIEEVIPGLELEMPYIEIPHLEMRPSFFGRKSRKVLEEAEECAKAYEEERAKEEAENTKSIVYSADGLVYYLESDIENEDSGKMEKFVKVFVISPYDDYEALCRWYRETWKAQD